MGRVWRRVCMGRACRRAFGCVWRGVWDVWRGLWMCGVGDVVLGVEC